MKPLIEFTDFEKIDLRVGRILSCAIPEWSSKLLELRVDFGAELGHKTIFAGVRKYFAPEDIINKQFVFVVNLPERKLGEGISQGMMLVASDETAHSPLCVNDAVASGAQIK